MFQGDQIDKHSINFFSIFHQSPKFLLFLTFTPWENVKTFFPLVIRHSFTLAWCQAKYVTTKYMFVPLCTHTNHCYFHLCILRFKCTCLVLKDIKDIFAMLCISLYLQLAATCSEKNPKYARPHAFRRPHVITFLIQFSFLPNI